jgi:hypothetical protein
MKKLLPIAFCSLAAISYSQLTLAGDDVKGSAGAGASSSADVQTPSRAGPTDNPNVTRDAQGREHVNKGKHTGQSKNKKDKDESAGSGSTSAPDSAKTEGSASSDAATRSDSTAGARSSDSTSLPSAGASVSGRTSESANGSVTTK